MLLFGQENFIRHRILNSDAQPLLRLNTEDVECVYIKNDGAVTDKIVLPDNFNPIGGGIYEIRYTPEECSQIGLFVSLVFARAYKVNSIETDAVIEPVETCLVSAQFVGIAGQPMADEVVVVENVDSFGRESISGELIYGKRQYYRTDQSGVLQMPIVRNARVHVICDKKSGIITVPDADVASLQDLFDAGTDTFTPEY